MEPIPNPALISTQSKHDNLYTVLLGVVSFFIAVGAVELEFIARRQYSKSAWVLEMTAVIEFMFLLAAVSVMLIRIAWPRYRKWPTMGLNIILLVMFPFGTALGIYGLSKVDKLPVGEPGE